MDEDDEITVELAPGSEVTIKYKAIGELQPNGKREVFFETYGVPRVIEMMDRTTNPEARITREKADFNTPGDIGAPMSGDILSVRTSSLLLPLPAPCMHFRVALVYLPWLRSVTTPCRSRAIHERRRMQQHVATCS